MTDSGARTDKHRLEVVHAMAQISTVIGIINGPLREDHLQILAQRTTEVILLHKHPCVRRNLTFGKYRRIPRLGARKRRPHQLRQQACKFSQRPQTLHRLSLLLPALHDT